ncbi:hypothetical protein [Acinetobacter venetianus]|uniref:hypothetical protein n=1 Tax=Acinetobacter venetianus TaxID=52133 RepID=UPI003A8DC2A0
MIDDSVLHCECENLHHEKFNDISKNELVSKVSIDDVFSESYCVSIGLDEIDEEFDLTAHETLLDLKGKMGIYGLWIQQTKCYDHDKYRMVCLYVGKGYALKRIKQHIADKWPKEQLLYVTFYECENRIAKYIEQLCLDNYNFALNKEENTGTGFLTTAWEAQRVELGTHIHELADRLAAKRPEQFK